MSENVPLSYFSHILYTKFNLLLFDWLPKAWKKEKKEILTIMQHSNFVRKNNVGIAHKYLIVLSNLSKNFKIFDSVFQKLWANKYKISSIFEN